MILFTGEVAETYDGHLSASKPRVRTAQRPSARRDWTEVQDYLERGFVRTDIPSKAALASHLPSPWRKQAFNGDCSMTPVTAQVGEQAVA